MAEEAIENDEDDERRESRDCNWADQQAKQMKVCADQILLGAKDNAWFVHEEAELQYVRNNSICRGLYARPIGKCPK